MTKIYFAGSIRGGRNDVEVYKHIINFVASLGHKVLTEHIGLPDVKAMGEAGRTEAWIYNRDLDWLKQSTAVIAEVTNPSLGVGYEIAKAEEWSKPVLALFRFSPDHSLSAMVAGNPNLHVVYYEKLPEAEAANKLPTTLRSGYSRLQTNPNWFAEWVIHPAT